MLGENLDGILQSGLKGEELLLLLAGPFEGAAALQRR